MLEIDKKFEEQAFREAGQRFPQFAGLKARLIARPVFQGAAYMLEYEEQPPASPDLWEFQNAVVKTYKQLKGV